MKRNVWKYSLIMCLFCILTSFEATWYGSNFNGNITASGEVFNKEKMTCASNHFPIGSKLLIINKENKKKVVVKVNDKGAFKERIIDLSESAFKKIAPLEKGRIKIKVVLLK